MDVQETMEDRKESHEISVSEANESKETAIKSEGVLSPPLSELSHVLQYSVIAVFFGILSLSVPGWFGCLFVFDFIYPHQLSDSRWFDFIFPTLLFSSVLYLLISMVNVACRRNNLESLATPCHLAFDVLGCVCMVSTFAVFGAFKFSLAPLGCCFYFLLIALIVTVYRLVILWCKLGRYCFYTFNILWLALIGVSISEIPAVAHVERTHLVDYFPSNESVKIGQPDFYNAEEREWIQQFKIARKEHGINIAFNIAYYTYVWDNLAPLIPICDDCEIFAVTDSHIQDGMIQDRAAPRMKEAESFGYAKVQKKTCAEVKKWLNESPKNILIDLGMYDCKEMETSSENHISLSHGHDEDAFVWSNGDIPKTLPLDRPLLVKSHRLQKFREKRNEGLYPKSEKLVVQFATGPDVEEFLYEIKELLHLEKQGYQVVLKAHPMQFSFTSETFKQFVEKQIPKDSNLRIYYTADAPSIQEWTKLANARISTAGSTQISLLTDHEKALVYIPNPFQKERFAETREELARNNKTLLSQKVVTILQGPVGKDFPAYEKAIKASRIENKSKRNLRKKYLEAMFGQEYFGTEEYVLLQSVLGDAIENSKEFHEQFKNLLERINISHQ